MKLTIDQCRAISWAVEEAVTRGYTRDADLLRTVLTEARDEFHATTQPDHSGDGGDHVLPGEFDNAEDMIAALRAPVPQDGEDERECLSDVVSHFDNLRAGLCAQRLAASDANDADSIAYWNHEISVLERMKAQAQAALASNKAPPVPQDGDERVIELMARAMNIATDGHDRYWSGYVKSATAAHKVVSDYLESNRDTAVAISRDAMQQKAINHGFEYWRASDAHGVIATNEQAINPLQDFLGVEVEIKEVASALAADPISMLLFCPRCGTQHIDKEEWSDDPHDIEQGQMRVWGNPPHRSHLCHACELIWRPADVATTGVASIQTKGKADTWSPDMPWTGHNRPLASNKAAAVASDDLVVVPRGLLGAACSAIDKKRDAPNVLAKLREITFAPKAAAVVVKRQDSVTLTGAQLLEALDFIAPDRATDADQLEGEVTLQHGDGHSGRGLYCWLSEYPDEGATLLSGEISPAPIASSSEAPLRLRPSPEKTGVGQFCQPGDRREPRWLLTFDDVDRGHSIFETEEDAREGFANAEGMGWNCWLFSPTHRATHPAAAQPSRAEVLDGVANMLDGMAEESAIGPYKGAYSHAAMKVRALKDRP